MSKRAQEAMPCKFCCVSVSVRKFMCMWVLVHFCVSVSLSATLTKSIQLSV